MASSLSIDSLSSPFPLPGLHPFSAHRHPLLFLHFHSLPSIPRLQASRRSSTFSQESGDLIEDPRNWTRIDSFFAKDYVIGDGDDGEDDDEEDDDEDRSLDLLVRFIQNMFKKVSRKARKSVRSVLPHSISPKLVSFSVNGTIILTFLWILKAFLQVICTLGSVVFLSILLIRGIWSWLAYLQESRDYRSNELDANKPWTDAQPAT